MRHTPRVFVQEKVGRSFTTNEEITLDVFDSNHLATVLKLHNGNSVFVFNDIEEWHAECVYASSKKVILRTISLKKTASDHPANIHLFFSPFKKLDILIEKSIEIGVTHLHPVLTEYSTLNNVNWEKYMKTAKKALEQSERIAAVEFFPLENLKNLPEKISYPIIACIERTENLYIYNIFKTLPSLNDIGILIGPEGGFSDQERQFITENDVFVPVSLGGNILRAETAGICATHTVVTLLNNKENL